MAEVYCTAWTYTLVLAYARRSPLVWASKHRCFISPHLSYKLGDGHGSDPTFTLTRIAVSERTVLVVGEHPTYPISSLNSSPTFTHAPVKGKTPNLHEYHTVSTPQKLSSRVQRERAVAHSRTKRRLVLVGAECLRVLLKASYRRSNKRVESGQRYGCLASAFFVRRNPHCKPHHPAFASHFSGGERSHLRFSHTSLCATCRI